MEEERQQKIEYIVSMMESGDLSQVRSALEDLRPADVSDVLMALPVEKRRALFATLGRELASEVLTLVDEGAAREIIETLDESRIVSLIELMASDDAADIINLLPSEKVQRVLGGISKEDYEDVRELLKFDEESAGGLMAREVMKVRGDARISDVVHLLKSEEGIIEHLQNIFVVDREGILLGFVPVYKLVVADPDDIVQDVMVKDFLSVTADTDQEEVAALFSKYDLYSLPVVDARGRLAGRITVDDIIDVIEEEATEDITIMAGTGEEEFWERSPVKVSRARLPWLLTGLFGGIASAAVMNHFKNSLESVLTLAFFVPVITAMGGNVGIQSSAIVVRELAIGGVSVVRTSGKLLRELKVSIINGFVLGTVLLAVVSLWQNDYRLGILLGICMMTIILLATLMGAVVPLLLRKMNIDPALATGPFITTSNDILGILIYLGIATLFLDWIGGG
jgi:magnesium transporter